MEPLSSLSPKLFLSLWKSRLSYTPDAASSKGLAARCGPQRANLAVPAQDKEKV